MIWTQICHLNIELSSRSFLDSPSSESLRTELRLHTNHSEKDRPSGTEHILRVNADCCAKIHFRSLLLLKLWEQTDLHEQCFYVPVIDRSIWLLSWRGSTMPLLVSERIHLDIHLIMIMYLLMTLQALQNVMSLPRSRAMHHIWFILPIIRNMGFQLLVLKTLFWERGPFIMSSITPIYN